MPLPKRRVQVFISEMAGDALDMIVARTGKTQTAVIEEAILGSKDFFGFDPERDDAGLLVSSATAAMFDEMHRQMESSLPERDPDEVLREAQRKLEARRVERENDHSSALPNVLPAGTDSEPTEEWQEVLAERNSPSPEAVQARAEKKAARATRKAERVEVVKGALAPRVGVYPSIPGQPEPIGEPTFLDIAPHSHSGARPVDGCEGCAEEVKILAAVLKKR